jgi:hypothetical protein
MQEFNSIDVRPHQLMLIVSQLGAGCTDDLGDPELTEILRTARANPSLPLTLRCPTDTNYDYQNIEDRYKDTAEELFYIRADLRIIQRMGMVPGATRPAIEIFNRLITGVTTALGILYFDEVTSDTWKGLGKENCHYDEGRALGVRAIVHTRDPEDEARYKVSSTKLMYDGEKLLIRPHHLMCMSCFFGSRKFAPPEKNLPYAVIPEDNLYEAIDIINKNPDIPIELVSGTCMICPPCYNYDTKTKRCACPTGMAVRDELKDLDVLQLLGMKYGDIMGAKELYTLLYEKVGSTRKICGHGDGVVRSPEFSICPTTKEPAYDTAKATGLGFLDQEED